MCQRLEDLHNSVNQYFPNDQCTMLQNQAWVKDSFKEQDKLMDFNVTECKKFIDRVSDSTLRLIFKRLPCVEFCYCVKEYQQLPEMATSLSSSDIPARGHIFFVCFNQNYLSQQIECRNSCLLLSHVLKKFANM